jgi:hypothetical protein
VEPTGLCRKCKKRSATTIWTGEGGVLSFVHGAGEPRCERCCIEEQIEFARNLIAGIPALEARFAELDAIEAQLIELNAKNPGSLKETS